MTTPQIIITLNPQGDLTAELPGLNGSRRKLPLGSNAKSQEAIANALEVLRDISRIEINSEATINNFNRLLSEMQNKVKQATAAANAISSLLDADNTLGDILLRILQGQHHKALAQWLL